jgi:hypothetical protein
VHREPEWYFIFSDQSTSPHPTETPAEEFTEKMIPENEQLGSIKIMHTNEKAWLQNQMIAIEFYNRADKMLFRVGRVVITSGFLSTHEVRLGPDERVVGVIYGRRSSTYSRVFDL